MTIKISSIYNLDDVNVTQLRQIAAEFKVDGVANKGLTDLRSAIETSTVFKDKFGDYNEDGLYYFCFGRTGNYICTLEEVSDINHRFIIPSVFNDPSIKTSQQRKEVLLHLAKYDHSGLLTISWEELLLPQMADIAKEFAVVIQYDNITELKELVAKSTKFEKIFGSVSVDDVQFIFHQDDPYRFKTVKQVGLPDTDSEISLLGDGFATPPQSVKQKAVYKHTSKEISCTENYEGILNRKDSEIQHSSTENSNSVDKSGKQKNSNSVDKSSKQKNKKDILKIYSICNIADASVMELNEIARVFEVDIDNIEDGEEVKSAILSSHSYKSKFVNTMTGKTIYGYFCFGKTVNYICALVDLNEKDHRIMLPGKFEHASITKHNEKVMVLLQVNKFSLEDKADLLWEDLLLPQIRDIGKEYQISFSRGGDDVNRLKQKIEKSAEFQRLFGKVSVEHLIYSFDKNTPYTCSNVRKIPEPVSHPSVSGKESVEESVMKSNQSDTSITKPLAHLNEAPTNSNQGVLEDENGKTTEIKVTDLNGELFIKLLDIFELIGNSSSNWDTNWAILQCSKYFLKKFGGYQPKDIVVVWNNSKVINVKTADGLITLEGNKSIYPCTLCCKEVTDDTDGSGMGLQCNKCNRYFHNNCMNTPVTKELYNALTDSPEYIQIFCPDCMAGNKSMEKISLDVDTIRKGITDVSYAAKINSGLVDNVKEAVVNMENTAKTQSGLMKLIPQRRSAESTASIQKNREEKLSKTIIVLKPKEHTNNSSEIRKEFNRKFPDVAVTLAVPTASGSVRLEFQNNVIRNDVAKQWGLDTFGGNSGVRTPTAQPTIGIIKQVDENTEDITEAIQHNYPGTELDFFRRNGQLTGTVKVIFKDHSSYEKAMNEGGLRLCGVKYNMDQYHPKPKVIRCYKCQNYGHIAPKCRAKESRCGICCLTGHQSNQCSSKTTNPKCIHCKGDHFTGSKICKEFKLVEDKLNILYSNNGR